MTKRKSKSKTKTPTKPERKQANLFAPNYPDNWTAADAAAADAEGWNIYEADGRGVLEIERNQENDPPHENAPTYEYDDDAIEHVRIRAAEGSELHARALAIHRRYRATQLTVMVSDSGEDEHDDRVRFGFFPDVDVDGDVGDRECEATKTISRDDAFVVLGQLEEALGNPAPVMGRLWWRADDLLEFVAHVEDVAKAGGRILSIDLSDKTCISYFFEIDKATADAKLGYSIDPEEWLIDDDHVVECLDDDGVTYVLATTQRFPDKASAEKYARTVARSRKARVRPVTEE